MCRVCAPSLASSSLSSILADFFNRYVQENIQEHTSALVVVERPWLDIIPSLPNVFDLKLFGR